MTLYTCPVPLAAALRHAFLAAALLTAPLATAPAPGNASESDAPFEEQQTEEQAQVFATSHLQRARRGGRPAIGRRVVSRKSPARQPPLKRSSHPQGHRLPNGLLAPLRS